MSFPSLSCIAGRLRFVFRFVLILMFLAGQSVWGISLASAAPQEQPLAASAPSVSLNVPAEAFIGSNVNFTVTFDNADLTDPGYGPLIDLIIPRNGADGAQNTNPPLDGLTFVSATYLGVNVESTVLTFPGSGGVTCVNHPYMVNNTGNPVQVCGNAGDTFVALRLPFGSFTPNQPPLNVDVTVSMSNLADLGTPLTIQARGGYQFGYTPLNDWCCGDDPSLTLSAWTSASVTPILFTLSKTYSGPEDETASGPNFPRRYTVTAAIAPGQTMTSFNLSDILPNNMQFVSLVSTNPGGASCTLPSTTIPGGALSCDFTSVSGTVTMTFEYYIPLRDSGGGSVIDPASGDDVTSCNNASGGGTWTPIDTRDTGGTFTQNPAGCEHTLTDKSIAIQKSVSVVGGGDPAPGKYLEYTLDFQVSDFFAFNNIVITDVISDGQRFAPGFVPTLQINGNTYTLAAAAMNASNVTTSCNYTGAIASPPAPPGECDSLDPAPNDGSTTLLFNVSQEIVDRGQDGRLIGGCVPTGGVAGDPNCGSYNDGPTTGRILFRTIIQQNFTDTFPSGDPSVDQGDSLNNTVIIGGTVLSTSDASTPTGQAEDDDSASASIIGRGILTKSVYAINGSTSFSTPVEVRPGDTVTYRLTNTLPTGDVEDLEFDDYLPLPVFHVGDPDENGVAGPAWTFDPTVSAAAPAAGVAKFGPSDTFYAYSSIAPTVTSNNLNNRLNFLYGDFDGTNEQQYIVDILFTVTVSDDPFADRLYLTNQAHAYEGSTNAGTADANAIVQIILTEPVLRMQKGIIWTDNPAAVFSPTPPGPVAFLNPTNSPRWSGMINSANLASTPINSDLSGVDAGDIVSFAIVIENTGSSGNGAFDIRLRDDLPAGFVIPGSGLNLQVHRGDGSPLGYTDLGGGLFGTGIEIVDPGAAEGACQQYDPNNGRNIILVTFDLELAATVGSGQQITNTASLTNYAGAEGGPNFLPEPQTDTARVTTRYAGLGKVFTTEIINGVNSQTQAVIGEFVDYTLTVTVPEGQLPNVTLEDNLPSGLAFVDCLSITPSSADLTTNLSGGFPAACNDPTNPSVSSPGQNFTFTLGTVTNANTDNSVDETLQIVFRAVVLNVPGNQAGTNLINRATLRIDGGAGGTATVQSAPLTVIEPLVNTTKSVTPAAADAGDTVTFTVTLSNPASGSTTAYDVTWSDTVPAGLTYTSGTLSGSCTTHLLTLSDASAPTLMGSVSPLDPGETCTLTFDATVDYSVTPGQIITNTAETRWTSLPGAVTDRSSYNTDSDERDGTGGLLGSGALNDYRTEGQASVTINNTTPQKFLVATSEAHTGAPDGTQRVAIGEIVRYRLVVQLPEGASPNFQIRDYLPGGLTYLDDGTARLALLSNGSPIASTEPAGSTLGLALGSGPFGTPPWVNGSDPTLVTPTYVLPDQNVGSSNSLTADPDSYGNSTDPYFKLGTLTNNDSDADAEYVIIEFNALINNTSAGSNDTGNARGNTFSVFINGVQNGPNSNSVRVIIAEPLLTLAKAVATAPTDAGDPIAYTLTISAASGVNRSTAFDLSLTDTFDAYLTSLSVTNVTTTQGATCVGNGGGTTPFSHNGGSFAGNTLTFTATCLDPGRSITITVSGTVAANAPAGYTIPNTGNLTYTSLPGPNGTTTNPTGSSTPGASGSDTGERDGSGGINDYTASGSANAPLAAPQIVKQAPTPTGYPIGATVTYPIAITLPEGVTRNVRVTDAVPAGMQYVSYNVDTSAFGGSVPVPTVSGGAGDGDDVTFNFGDITTTDDNNPANNTFTLLVTLRVLDVPANEIGTVLTNGASLTYTPGTGSTDTTLSGGTQNITVLEPRIATTKSVVPNSNVQAGSLLTYTVRFTNTGTATAYDVTAEDVLAQGVTYNNDAACVFFDGASTSAIAVTVTAGVGTLTFDGNPAGAWDIPATDPNDSYIECTYTATAQNSLHLDGTHTNTVDADWTSLNGPDANERVYDDSVLRTVDGTQDTATATFTSPAPAFDKSDTATNLPIGATYTVTLTITSPLGTLRNLTVTDTLPAGLFYVTGTQSVSGGISPAPTFAVGGPNDGSAPTTLTWTFGDAVVSSSPVTLTYNVTVANVVGNQNGVSRTNNAAITYDDAQGNAKSLTDNDNVTVIEPVLTVDKVISIPPVPPDAGGTVTYQVTIQHDGASTATAYDTNFTDALPADLSLNLASVNVTLAGGAAGATDNSAGNTVNVTIATIPVGGSVTVTYSATINSGVTPGQVITNTGNLTWTSTAGANPDERNGSGGINDYTDSDQESFAIQSAAYDKMLEAASAAHTSGSDLAIGEVATFGLYVTLPEGTTPSLTIVDDLPAGLAYVSGSAQVVTTVAGCGALTADFNGSVPAPTITAPGGSGGDVTFQFGAITVAADNDPANNTFVICFDAVLLNEAGNQNGNTLTNNVSFQIDGGPLTTDSTTVDVVEPELDIAKAVSNPTPGVGQTFTYTLTVQHLGSSTAHAFDLNLSDTLPASVAVSLPPTVSNAPGGCAGTVTDSSAGNNISLTVASLPLGCALTVQYQAVVVSPPAAPGDVINNTANLAWTSLVGVDPNERTSAGGVDDYADSASQNITFTAVDLRITKDDGGITSTAGGMVAYTLNYTNAGNSVATGVVITETVPANTTFNAGASTPGWSCADGSPAGTTCTLTVGTLNPADSGSVVFAVTVNNPLPSGVTQIANTASIADDGTHGADATPTDNSDDDTTPVDAAPDLTITKDDGFTVVSPGQIVTYTLTIANVGTQDATGIVVTDTLPANTTFVSASDGGTEAGGVVTWPAFDLAAGAPAVTRTVTIQVDDPFPGASILNRAHVQDDGSNGPDLTPGDNDDDDTDAVLTLPHSDLTKTLLATNQGFTPDPSVAIGEILTYQVVFTVPAGGTLPNLTLTDTLDRGLAFVDCLSVAPSSADITTTLPGGFAAACNDPANPTVQTEPPGSPNLADPGRRVTFTLGDVSNSGATDGTVTIQYTVAVLDNIENQDGVLLNNSATLTWASGSLAGSASDVAIVEPDLSLNKAADVSIAVPGTIITFTLTVQHTAASSADAYDVLLEDIVPSGLEYIPGSLIYVSGIAPTTLEDTTAPTLQVIWNDFPRLPGQSVIQFQARLQNLPPGASVVNEAQLEWSSLPGDISTPQSAYNVFSTERRYDPLSPIDIYGVVSRFDIRVPALPATGFAPGKVTEIPIQTAEQAYTSLGSLWLEIPRLGVKMPIVGIPARGSEWDLTWLGNQAGWLNGTAFPTTSGNSVITGHVYLPNGQPGPFIGLGKLNWGDQIIIHTNGFAYTYEVRSIERVSPNNLSVYKHEKLAWVTLITCQGYNVNTNTYAYRLVARAVLMKVEVDINEPTTSH